MVSSGVGGERLHGCRGLCRDPRNFAAEMVHRKVKGLEFPKMLSLGEAITGDLVALPGTPANIFSNPGTPAAQHHVDGTMTVELIGEALEDCAWDIEDEEGDQLEDLVNWYSFLKSGKDCEEKASLSFSCCVGIRDSET